MSKVTAIVLCVLSFNYQALSQIIRSPVGLFSRPLTETIIDGPRNYIDNPRAYEIPRNYIDVPIEGVRNYSPRILEGSRIIEASRNFAQPTIIAEPCNGIAPVVNPNIPRPSTTIITDCTPSVCKNLADTINLMIVSNLLQHTKGGEEAALRLAAPLLKDILSNPALAGYANSIPNFGNPNVIPFNIYASNFVAPNVAPAYVAPNFIASSLYDSVPIAPRMVNPNNIAPATSLNAPINNGALLSSLLKLLGGAV